MLLNINSMKVQAFNVAAKHDEAGRDGCSRGAGQALPISRSRRPPRLMIAQGRHPGCVAKEPRLNHLSGDPLENDEEQRCSDNHGPARIDGRRQSKGNATVIKEPI